MAEGLPGQREASLRLDLLGGFALHDAHSRELAIRSKKAQALLAILALATGRPQARAKLIALLWSDRGEAQARSSLRQALSELRKALPDVDPPILTGGREEVCLDPRSVAVDAVTLGRLIEEDTADSLAQAAELYRGDLLDGLDVRDAAFEEWRTVEGEGLRARTVAALGRLLETQTGGEAVVTARRLLALDPLNEHTHRALMGLYAEGGDRGLAVKQYEACRQLLRAELGLEPEADTKRLVDEIRRGAGESTADPAAMETPRKGDPPPLPDKPSIAVLPFTNLSGDPEQDYFSDGITEDIIAELARFRSLFVIARDSCFTFKGRVIKAQDVGRDLGVAYLAQGSVRKAGNRLRVAVQLVKAADGETVWAERYDRELADVFAIQDEITENIAATIGGRLEAEDRRRASQDRQTHPTAYDCVLRAQALYHLISRATNAEACPLLEKAIQLDPDNPRAHVLMAAIHHMDYLQGWSQDPQRSLDLALRFGQKAVALDDADSLGHAQLGEILRSHGRVSEEERHFEKALALNPNDVEARAIYGACVGGERGLDALNFAERLDPCSFVWIPWIKGTILFELRRYDEAIAMLEQIDSRIVSARGWLAASLAQAGRLEEARATLQEYLNAARKDLAVFPNSPAAWEMHWQREGQYRHEGDFEHLREGLRKAGLDV
jgi:TolB-like protein